MGGRQSTVDSFGKTKDNAEAQRALRFAEYGEEGKLRRGRQSTVDSPQLRKGEGGNFTAEAPFATALRASREAQRFGEEWGTVGNAVARTADPSRRGGGKGPGPEIVNGNVGG